MAIKRDDLKLDGKVHIPEWGAGGNMTNFNEGAACAHVQVKYAKIKHSNGMCSDNWVCAHGCGQMFMPIGSPISKGQMADRVDKVHDLLKEMVDFFRDNFNSSADFLNASSARYFDGLLKTADAALALPAPMADRASGIAERVVAEAASAFTTREQWWNPKWWTEHIISALDAPKGKEYPKPCGLCPGTIESREDLDWHGLGNCVPICEACDGSGIKPDADKAKEGYDQQAVGIIKNLAMLVRRLGYKHPNEKLVTQSLNYLRGEGLQGSVLRASATPAPSEQEQSSFSVTAAQRAANPTREANDTTVPRLSEAIERLKRLRNDLYVGNETEQDTLLDLIEFWIDEHAELSDEKLREIIEAHTTDEVDYYGAADDIMAAICGGVGPFAGHEPQCASFRDLPCTCIAGELAAKHPANQP